MDLVKRYSASRFATPICHADEPVGKVLVLDASSARSKLWSRWPPNPPPTRPPLSSRYGGEPTAADKASRAFHRVVAMLAPETAGSACPLQAHIKDQRKPMRYIALCGIEAPNQPHLSLRLSAAIEGALHWCSLLPAWPRRGSIQRAAGRHSRQAN